MVGQNRRQVRRILLLCLLSFSSFAPALTIVQGDIRVQALTDNVIRLEKKGPKGFEDRSTFHVIQRNDFAPDVRLIQLPHQVRVESDRWTLSMPKDAKELSEVKLVDKQGNTLYKVDGKESNSVWLPEPGRVPKAWAFADKPRIVPPPYPGYVKLLDQPNCGWDLGNDAQDVYIFIPNGSYANLRRAFLGLTGRTSMPPLYIFGLIDSRYYVYTEQTALQRIDDYRARKIPLDVLVIDTDWRVGASHGYGADPRYFPDLPRFFNAAKAKHVRTMFNDHPEPQAPTALDPKEIGYRYEGLSGLLKQGLDSWWYDRNWHVGLVEPLPSLRKEVWGMMLYRDVTLSVRQEQRPLIMANVDGIDNGYLNRPPNVAAHRFPIQWTGDTQARWPFLELAVENALISGVRGLNPYVHEDLGGHAFRPTRELYIRFVQFGALSPIMRLHCTKGETREPWAFGADAERIGRDYTNLRYRLLPLLYSSAREAYDTGLPIMRRLDLVYPSSEQTRRNDQYLLGRDLLVAPIIQSATQRPAPASAFEVEFFEGKNFEKSLSKTTATGIQFDWGMGSPSGVPEDDFSLRAVGKIGPLKGIKPYRLSLTADDGVRMWIDGKLVIDKWIPEDSVTTEADLTLDPSRSYDVKIEYFEATRNAVLKMGLREVTGGVRSVRDVWVPPGSWVDLWSGKRVVGPRVVSVSATLDQTPMFVRAGGLLVLAPEMQYTGQRPWDHMTIESFVTPNTSSSFELYEDDGETWFYQGWVGKNQVVSANHSASSSTVTIGAQAASSQSRVSSRSYSLRLHCPRAVAKVTVDGRTASWKVLKPSAKAFPLKGAGSAVDRVVQVELPKASAKKKRLVQVTWK